MAKRFLLTLSTADEANAVLRLRAALKVLWRRFGLRCVSAEEVPTAPVSEKGPQAKPKDMEG